MMALLHKPTMEKLTNSKWESQVLKWSLILEAGGTVNMRSVLPNRSQTALPKKLAKSNTIIVYGG